jgi:hypothetical protein
MVLIVVTQLLFLGPLLLFCPKLVRSRRDAVASYGGITTRYGRGLQEKWMEGEQPKDEPLLGSADVQSLADMGNSFRFVTEMGLVPLVVGRSLSWLSPRPFRSSRSFFWWFHRAKSSM